MTVFVVKFQEGDPSNYMTFYRRATVYLAMGKSKQALPDLNTVIELKPDFTAVSLDNTDLLFDRVLCSLCFWHK